MKKQKIIIILGSTSSGKTDLSIELAKKFNGEVISADSRQVYKGLNIGSGKVTKTEMRGVSHHLLDVASPRSSFSVVQFKKKAEKAINDILKRGKVPIIAGGTGFYIQAIVDNIVLPEIKVNKKLRKELEDLIEKDKEKGLKELIKRLKKLDPKRLKEIDQKNPRRLMRAIEIATQLGKVPKIKIANGVSDTPRSVAKHPESNYNFLQIGIKTDKDVLNGRIEKRFKKRVRTGIVAEAKRLHEQGVSWKRMNEIGLAHKHISEYLRGKISKKEMIENSIKEERKYAKRQRTWFKRDKKIHWFEFEDSKSPKMIGQEKEINKLVKNFLGHSMY